MLRVLALLLLGLGTIVSTGCVGPMGAGCCGIQGGPGFCDGCSTGCDDASCQGCDSCTGCGELYVDPWVNHPADCVDPCDSCGNYNGQSCGKCRSMFAGMKSLWGYRCGCSPAPVVMSDRCFASSCSSGCDGGCDSCAIEPACGCEGACDCGFIGEPGCGLEISCGVEPGCGLEPACGLEPGCGLEPACGCEGACDCGGIVHDSYGPTSTEMIGTPTMVEPSNESSIEASGSSYTPSRTRKIFNPRTQTASRGFLNQHRR